MKSTKFWVVIIASVLVISAAASFFIMNGHVRGAVIANIYQNGECLHSVDLSAVEESYTIQIGGKISNTVSIEKGRICILEATCPDHVCVHQGWISNGVVPIICLPNNVVIQIEGAAASDIDAISR